MAAGDAALAANRHTLKDTLSELVKGGYDELKDDDRKVPLAALLRRRTSVGVNWIAERLAMGYPGSVSRLIGCHFTGVTSWSQPRCISRSRAATSGFSLR